ncbi:Dehydrogenase/reductase SDR family member on chromosome X [Neolecta irregularis DAH-3]|uniref:Dehydrogenase/reductase SDR family member on chromosome X n=1 Tax=Neolecta irregularis (strain DAH-3) TaxID=1198029 RepID=A0A1U7LHA5_NEOID|nr:Dehydrogenase/reductase SDR family member on chromosome X [Neolecta irregularis DAH-3]|eukprot:OLL21932.1 Dehydrogenase/reductase SDR family member on chromosome X [Neolecta irregularis DAH-3]
MGQLYTFSSLVKTVSTRTCPASFVVEKITSWGVIKRRVPRCHLSSTARMFATTVAVITAKSANREVSLAGKQALVIGGTQGIGASIALRLSSLGAAVTIAGRNEKLAESVISKAENKMEFEKVDLSLISGIYKFAAEMKKKFGPTGLHYMFNSAGSPPGGSITLTCEGFAQDFTIQCMGRLLVTYKLLPVLKDGTSVWVAAPASKGGKVDLEDPDLSKTLKNYWVKFLAQALRDSAFLDSMAMELAERNPNLRVLHLFPGIVGTNVLSNNGFNWIFGFASRLLTRAGIAQKPDDYAEVAVYLAIKDHSTGVHFYGPNLKSLTPGEWVMNDGNRKKLWDWAIKTGERIGTK